jgi:hypothetical protein
MSEKLDCFIMGAKKFDASLCQLRALEHQLRRLNQCFPKGAVVGVRTLGRTYCQGGVTYFFIPAALTGHVSPHRQYWCIFRTAGFNGFKNG